MTGKVTSAKNVKMLEWPGGSGLEKFDIIINFSIHLLKKNQI